MLRDLAYVDGRWIGGSSRGTFPVTNPATCEIIGEVASLDTPQIHAAIDAADLAYRSWRALLAGERADILIRWRDLIVENREDLARIVVLEQGKPLNEARGEIDYAASFVYWFAEEGRRASGETIPSHIQGATLAFVREPIGVAALITPWNFPVAMITRKAAAALAIGCAVVIKPAEETPYSALALAQLAERAGIPPGVFNVVTGDAPAIVNIFCKSEKVRALSFTGSTRVGRILLRQCAPTIKKCSMELGGNAPFIVLPDMDADVAASAAIKAKFQTSGQDCLAANRIFVHRELYEPFLLAFARHMASLRIGNGMDEAVQVGPMINEKAVEKAGRIVNDALCHGARLVVGDQEAKPGPKYFMPTLLADVTPQMRVFREETFCPVAGVLRYDTLQEAVSMANATEYGLAAYVYGRDIQQITTLMKELEFGMIGVNAVEITGSAVPFGGMKQSGLGREGSRQGLEEFSEIKYYCVRSP